MKILILLICISSVSTFAAERTERQGKYVFKTAAGTNILVEESDQVYFYQGGEGVAYKPPLLKFYLDRELKKDLIAESYIYKFSSEKPKYEILYTKLKFYKHSLGNFIEESIFFGTERGIIENDDVLNRAPYFGGCSPEGCRLGAFFIEEEGENWLSMYLTVRISEKENKDIKVYVSKAELLKSGYVKLPSVDHLYKNIGYSLKEYNDYMDNLIKIVKARDSNKLTELARKCFQYSTLTNSKIKFLKELDQIQGRRDEKKVVSESLFKFLEKMLTNRNDSSTLDSLLSLNESRSTGTTVLRQFSYKSKLGGYNYFTFLLLYDGVGKGCFDIIEDELMQEEFNFRVSQMKDQDKYLDFPEDYDESDFED
ncbi:hypothetical protein [Bacteriovorax sp. Seq25_V]|uniref:hypothetical protein n=1 Tax=Bacteriovorax sp. Seq25_V TaxID=1201288 RepID=UPI000389E01F|nr:hypothetical protein [Bacteriovorax sp. Seq25_V]EQC45443.1 hypothetical protein M900_2144 [Bacteriovorax sp. Seq25_V]